MTSLLDSPVLTRKQLAPAPRRRKRPYYADYPVLLRRSRMRLMMWTRRFGRPALSTQPRHLQTPAEQVYAWANHLYRHHYTMVDGAYRPHHVATWPTRYNDINNGDTIRIPKGPYDKRDRTGVVIGYFFSTDGHWCVDFGSRSNTCYAMAGAVVVKRRQPSFEELFKAAQTNPRILLQLNKELQAAYEEFFPNSFKTTIARLEAEIAELDANA